MAADPTEGSQEWWLAVRSIASLVTRDGVGPDEDHIIRQELAEQGFSPAGIGLALDWVDRAALSGHLIDALGMLQPEGDCVRVEHPLERVSLNPTLWQAIDICRRRGFLTADVAERLVEGARTLDTRDWDDGEIESFLEEVLSHSSNGLSGISLAEILSGEARDQYN
jgi:hypothetical protein